MREDVATLPCLGGSDTGAGITGTNVGTGFDPAGSSRKARRHVANFERDIPYRQAVAETSHGPATLSMTIISSSSLQRLRRHVSMISSRSKALCVFSIGTVCKLEAYSPQDGLLRRRTFIEAMDYMRKRGRLRPHHANGRTCLTNSAAERAPSGRGLRHSSWLFAGSYRGADRCALMHTLIAMAKLMTPPRRLRLPTCSPHRDMLQSRLEELLPWNWGTKPSRSDRPPPDERMLKPHGVCPPNVPATSLCAIRRQPIPAYARNLGGHPSSGAVSSQHGAKLATHRPNSAPHQRGSAET